MKKLFFLLLVVNLVIWLWGQREEFGRVTGTAQPDFGAIRVIDEAELAARREQAAARAQVSPPVQSAPADVEQRVVTAQAEPVRTAPVAQQLAEAPPEAAPDVVEATPGPPLNETDTPPPAFPAVAAGVVPEPAALQDRRAPAAAPEGTEVAAMALDAAPVAPGPASADSAGSPTDSTLSAPSAEVAAPMAETAPITTDAGALESAGLPEEAAPVDAAQSEPARSEVPDQLSAPAETIEPGDRAVASEPVSESREVLYLCESLGPFRERAAAERIAESLQAPLRDVALREERVARTTRYWVLAPVQPDRQALADYVGRLEQAGVRDAWRIPSGPFAGRLAVGVFQSAGNARKHAEMLEAQGVAAEVHAPKDEERRYWIDYERPADADAPEPAAARSLPSPQIVPRDCGRVAGP